jgi:hypothetical protein
MFQFELRRKGLPSRHSTERGSAGSKFRFLACLFMFDPALPRSVLCLLGSPFGVTETSRTLNLYGIHDK